MQNIINLDIEQAKKIISDAFPNMFESEDWSAIQMMHTLSDVGEFLANSTLTHPNVQDLMKYGRNFDAVVVEVFFVEALYGKFLIR